MAMNATTLANSMKSAYDTAYTNTNDHDAALTALCGSIATAIITCVEEATITYTTGLIAPSGGGDVTGVFGNTIA